MCLYSPFLLYFDFSIILRYCSIFFPYDIFVLVLFYLSVHCPLIFGYEMIEVTCVVIVDFRGSIKPNIDVLDSNYEERCLLC